LGKKIRFASIAALALTALQGIGLHAQTPDGLRLEGIRMRLTAGTSVLNRVTADRALLSEDGTQVLTDRLRVIATTGDEREVNAEAITGRIAVAGAEPAEEPHVPTLEEIRSYFTDFATKAGYGDVLLEGTEELPAVAKVAEDARIVSPIIIWSQLFGQVILPGDFQQDVAMKDGGQMKVTANALTVDSEFRNWVYFSEKGSPAVIEFIPGENAGKEQVDAQQ
jgi:hypothetical protein